ncbi:ABC transporter ATP-binding protein [Motilibacter deserti]|uniref:ABC transporter ATP-binding protein n=1 Tax=Motilibacter deserti TaxID=2714956 RepID=A0ABX0GPT8_9ACTN|nr:ABC transporter ATP-binding protein [Motilibacter deserti]NHC12844.1 ABC transporter ATP-binding protein [Motilibacter deserti]
MAGIEITELHKRFPDGTVAVEKLDLSMRDGELFVMLGPSGCGKTTTLRSIAGLERQTSGDIRIGHRLVNDLPPAERDIAMVFQFYALYPHLRAKDNIAFPLRAEGTPEAEVKERVAEAARMLRLEALLERRPNQLSGGEQQRVALARALIRQPLAFLMDEPLTNLDAELRADMRTSIKHLQQRLGTTMVYVTHDQLEAMSLGDRIAILNKGRLEQVGTPLEVYNRPASLFCAGFIGSPPMNLLPVEVSEGRLRTPGGLSLVPPGGLSTRQGLVAGVRPEQLEVTTPDAGDAVPARIVSEEVLGDEIIYVVSAGGADVRVRMPPTSRFGLDAPVGLRHTGSPPPVYDATSERLVA